MPSIVPSSTIQSRLFMRRRGRRAPATRRKARRTRTRKGKRRARCESPAPRVILLCRKVRATKTSFPERYQIREQAISAGNSGRQLPEESETRVNEIAFAVLRDEQAALERRFARIAHGKNRRVMFRVETA